MRESRVFGFVYPMIPPYGLPADLRLVSLSAGSECDVGVLCRSNQVEVSYPLMEKYEILLARLFVLGATISNRPFFDTFIG